MLEYIGDGKDGKSTIAQNFVEDTLDPKKPIKRAIGCDPKARCLKVNVNGLPTSDGQFVAQCQIGGRFPDYIVHKQFMPAPQNRDHNRWFKLSQYWDLIGTKKDNTPALKKLKDFDPFKKTGGIDDFVQYNLNGYMLALRDYIYGPDASVPNWDTAEMRKKWFHVPRLNYGDTPTSNGLFPVMTREVRHGMTRERTLPVGELAGNNVNVRNYAIGYYNRIGVGGTIKWVWVHPLDKPGIDIVNEYPIKFPVNTVVFKV